MTGRIIESDAREFVRRLPELSPGTAHLLMLAVRSRLVKEIEGVKANDIVVDRKIARHRDGWRDTYFDKLYNMAILQTSGARYKVKDKYVSGETMGIFGTIGPRDAGKAVTDIMSRMAGWLYHQDVTQLDRLDVEFFGSLHSHKAGTGPKFVTVDIDDPEAYKPILDVLESFPVWMVTQTSRGYHIILDLSDGADCKDWGKAFYLPGKGVWPEIHKKWPDTVELINRAQEPVPGTLYHRSGQKEPNYVKILR